MKKALTWVLNLIVILNCAMSITFAAGAAVLITATPSEGIYGNNFYKDNPPCFTVHVKNASLVSAFNGTLSYSVTKNDGTVIFESDEKQQLSIPAKKTQDVTVSVEKEYYGRLNLNITVESGNDKTVKTIPYTMSNNGNVMNKKFGISSHLGKNEGDMEISLSLLKGAGIGSVRDELFTWPEVEKVKGDLVFTDEMSRKLDLLDEYGLFYIHMWGHGNNALYPDANLGDEVAWQYLFPTTKDGLNALSDYIEGLVEFADGRIDVLEVWNEFNNFSGPYKKDYQHMVNYHKAVNKGVERAVRYGAKDVTVSGIDTDGWGVFVHGEVEGFLDLLEGDKVFDAVSLHPYNNLNDFNDDPPETGITKSIVEETKRLLGKYGQNSNVDFYFTESGWGDSLLNNDREMQAAYNIRQQAKVHAEGLVEVSCLYTLFDGDGDKIDDYFGILEPYNKAYTEVPYIGKEAYPAIAYYNNLMANAEFVEMIPTAFGDECLIYHFKDRNNRDVLMLNTLYNDEKSISLNLGVDSCTVSDMYGNEKVLVTPTGNVNLTVLGIPSYIICDGLNEKPEVSERKDIYGIASGITKPDSNIVLNVYNDGYTPENTTSENVSKAFYYTEQKKTDSDGNFSFSFPLDENFKSKNAYIYIDGEENPRIYKTESWGDFALSYEAFPDKNESNHEFFAYLSGDATRVDKIELVSAGYDTDGRLLGIAVAQNQLQETDLFIKKVELDLGMEQSKLMIISDIYTLKPLIPSINLR